MLAQSDVDPRTWHYREFYGLVESSPGAGVVLGNCQAESLRLVMDAPNTPTVRLPPVHELTVEDIPHLRRCLQTAPFVVTQPIRRDYRGLPVGTAQVRAQMPAGRRLVVVPAVRYAGLHPFQLIIRLGGRVPDPPLVPYHDVRELASAAGVRLRSQLPVARARAVGEASVLELVRRERESGAIPISDVFASPDFDMMRTVNHPGNPIWMALGSRVLDALGADHGPIDPHRPLLFGIQAPREAWVAEAWGIDVEPRADWIVDGAAVSTEAVAEAHARWYRDRPEFVREAMEHEAETVRLWAS